MVVEEGRSERSKEVFVRATLMDDKWICKSENSRNEWMVWKENGGYGCSCPDFKKRGGPCKHIIAVMKENNKEI